MLNTYRHGNLKSETKTLDCGERDGYQIQVMDILELPATYSLLNPSTDPELSPEPALATLAQQVNAFFAPKAKAALQAKRNQLTADGHGDVAARTEITVLLTKNGLQLGFDRALSRKEIAPAPRKGLLRRLLGPLYPGRKYWVMPATAASGPGETYTVRWPWFFWLGVLLALLGGTFAFAPALVGMG